MGHTFVLLDEAAIVSFRAIRAHLFPGRNAILQVYAVAGSKVVYTTSALSLRIAQSVGTDFLQVTYDYFV